MKKKKKKKVQGGRDGRPRGEEGWPEEEDVGRDKVDITNLVKKDETESNEEGEILLGSQS